MGPDQHQPGSGEPAEQEGTGEESFSRHDRFMRLFLSHERRIFGLILAMVGHWPDAEDVMQESASVMWRKFDQFEPGSDFAAWAMTVARFQVMAYRKRKAVQRARLSDQTVEALADRIMSGQGRDPDVRAVALRRCLAKLNERERQLIELRYEAGQPTKVVAEQLGRSIHAVYKALNRIHNRLIECIAQTLAAERAP